MLRPRVELRLALPQPGPTPAIGNLGANSAINGSTSAKIALAHGKIGVMRGRIHRKIWPSGVTIVDRTFVIRSMATIPGLTSGKTIRMQPVGP